LGYNNTEDRQADGGILFRIQNEALADRYPAGSQTMDVQKMLAELRQEREQIEEAIITLERLARGRGKRRGRPPAWMTAAKKRIKTEEAKKAPAASKTAAS
jgi:ABC-type transporter Mla subunit MlaD